VPVPTPTPFNGADGGTVAPSGPSGSLYVSVLLLFGSLSLLAFALEPVRSRRR
jgi:hypothetical protein